MKQKCLFILQVCTVLLFVHLPAQAETPLQNWFSDQLGTDLYGFVEARNGFRVRNHADEKEMSIGEARLQLDLGKDINWGVVRFKGDLVGDAVTEEVRAELREMNLLFSPAEISDIKAGRQVLTWGTGDLLFINDLFPKDWESFFIGRDDEYLKAPSDAVKASLFLDSFNLDLVYVPEFNGSIYPDGSRISYWNSMLGRIAGRDFVFADHERNRVFRDSEYAARLSKNHEGIEYAFYFYSGFWKTPEGVDPLAMRLVYPRLNVYGASARKTLMGGIGNAEIGYYDSRQDRRGGDPNTRNSEIRILGGYEREIAREFTGSVQYYGEYMQDYADYKSSLPAGMRKKDEFRQVATLRLTKLMLNQNLKLSFFIYFSPTDKDTYFRPKAQYKISDYWTAEIGGNIFWGSNDHTFFGQFEDNTNAFVGVRRSF